MFEAFEKGNNRAAAIPMLEKTLAIGTPIENYHATNIETTHTHHISELVKKRRWVPSESELLSQVCFPRVYNCAGGDFRASMFFSGRTSGGVLVPHCLADIKSALRKSLQGQGN